MDTKSIASMIKDIHYDLKGKVEFLFNGRKVVLPKEKDGHIKPEEIVRDYGFLLAELL